MITDDAKVKLLRLVYSQGILDTSKLVGGYEKLIKLTDGDIPNDMKITEIREVIHDIGGIGFGETPFEEPIFYDEQEGEIHQIEYFGINTVIIQVWGGYKHSDDLGEYKVSYESLPTPIIDEIMEIVSQI